METLLSVLNANGNDMTFNKFVSDVRAQGANPALWRRAKMSGALYTYFGASGELRVKAGKKPAQGGA